MEKLLKIDSYLGFWVVGRFSDVNMFELVVDLIITIVVSGFSVFFTKFNPSKE